MTTLTLISPTVALEQSYRELICEFDDAGEERIPFPLKYPNDDFPAMVKRLADEENGVGIQDGWVSHSTFWLVADKKHIVAVSNLRHQLTNALRREGGHIGYGVRPSARRKGNATRVLKETLEQAAARGIEQVLITCDKHNIGSAKAIQNNSGVLDSEEYLEENKCIIQRWLINITPCK